MVLQYLYFIQPTRLGMLTDGGTPEEQTTIGQHFAYLEKLMANGVLIMAGRTLNADETTFGIAIFNAEDDEAAQQILHDDPISNTPTSGTLDNTIPGDRRHWWMHKEIKDIFLQHSTW